MSLLKVIQETLLDKINDLRAVHYALTGKDFRELFDFSRDIDQYKILKLVQELNIRGVVSWIEEQRVIQRAYNKMPVDVLRRLAKHRRLKYSQHVSKVDLILLLEEDDEQQRSKRSDWTIRKGIQNTGHQSGCQELSETGGTTSSTTGETISNSSEETDQGIGNTQSDS